MGHTKSILLLSAVLFVSTASFAMGDIAVYGEAAQSLAQALINSGFKTNVDHSVRTLSVDHLVMSSNEVEHQCDDRESVECGMKPFVSISLAEQNGVAVHTKESMQLAETLQRVIDPIYHTRNMNVDVHSGGRVYRDYGAVTCHWSVTSKAPYLVSKSECILVRSN